MCDDSAPPLLACIAPSLARARLPHGKWQEGGGWGVGATGVPCAGVGMGVGPNAFVSPQFPCPVLSSSAFAKFPKKS